MDAVAEWEKAVNADGPPQIAASTAGENELTLLVYIVKVPIARDEVAQQAGWHQILNGAVIVIRVGNDVIYRRGYFVAAIEAQAAIEIDQTIPMFAVRPGLTLHRRLWKRPCLFRAARMCRISSSPSLRRTSLPWGS